MKFPVLLSSLKTLSWRIVLRRTWWGASRLAVVLLLIDAGYLIGIWPAWEKYAAGPVQQSNFIRNYVVERHRHRDWPQLRWYPVPFESIPKHMVRALVVAEDSRFYSHSGFDTEAFMEAMETNIEKKRLRYGASTISQQTVKNIFLTPSRNPLRKWHEVLLTAGMERHLSKNRILELYLNVAEFGRGIYGVEAAARHYWGIPAAELNEEQAIELAATLPSPVRHNPRTRTRTFLARVDRIGSWF